MQQISTLSEKLVKAVFEFRGTVDQWFLTPSRVDSIAYAVTEAAEVVDADLRSRRAQDLRNQDKQSTVEEEVGDVMLMVCTALGPNWTQPNFTLVKSPYPIAEIVVQLGMAYAVSKMAPDQRDRIDSSLFLALICCIQQVGKDKATEILSARMNRILEKRVKPAQEKLL
jgi:NTP pyrophosphatase (non-canonical NTP hydrolase)